MGRLQDDVQYFFFPGMTPPLSPYAVSPCRQ